MSTFCPAKKHKHAYEKQGESLRVFVLQERVQTVELANHFVKLRFTSPLVATLAVNQKAQYSPEI